MRFYLYSKTTLTRATDDCGTEQVTTLAVDHRVAAGVVALAGLFLIDCGFKIVGWLAQ